ncbi:hypothetical protein AX16_007438 [Volvariella volvacea WC 439]|nr:hypothetical protein AX16_007438 [Volvariella volvacea WC 439]
MAPYSKPETVLKQAEGLVSVGQTHAALQSLSEMFTSKKFRMTPLASLEPIMHRFIELCVDMRKGRTAKEGLMQYKNIAQNTSVQSIEAVITRFVQLADAKVREAQEKAAVKVALDVDDLEASETPESILLGAVSGDQSKDRTDRALVTPWLKFLWESYRTSLETLKNNARLESIYQQIAQQAFKFCLKYQRKVEFRRLCETLRLHLSNVAKYSHQPHSINLSDPDTLQHHLDTRFAQLNTSVELELWQEAFRSVEDVHNLLTLAKKAPRPAMMANYYEKLTKIFLMSGNALYHAAAWGRYYAVAVNIGGKSGEELSRLAGQVLVSALAVPVGLPAEESEEVKGRNARLMALLGLSRPPTRSGLLKEALSRDVLKLSPPVVKSLYNILEVTFDPLTLCASVAPILQNLSKDESYASYLPLLQRALLSRLLSQLSQVYSTITVSSLLSLVTPLKDAGIDGAYDDEQVEAYVMGCARRGELNIRVDHSTGSITFVDDAYVIGEEFSTGSSGWASDEVVQPSTKELVRTRLSKVALCLHKSLSILEPEGDREVLSEEGKEKFRNLVAAVEAERKALQLRRAVVARRRELLSELTVRKEKEESSRRAEQARREKEDEDRRLKEEFKRKEIERTKREIENIRAEETKKYAQTLVDKGIIKASEVEKLENYDTEGLINIQVQQLEKEKKEMNDKLRIISKRIDHIERAYRKEERPLLAKDYERQQGNDRETFEAVQKSRKEVAKLAHQEDLETKARLLKMLGDYKARKDTLIKKKGDAFAQKMQAAQRKIDEEKTKRTKLILQQREEERKRKEAEDAARREREEEERRQEEARLAEEQRLREEEERQQAEAERIKREQEEAAASARKAREAQRAETERIVALQRQREEEAEARRLARNTASRENKESGDGVWRRRTTTDHAGVNTPPRAESPAPAPAPVSRFQRGGAAAGSGWRVREAAKNAAGAATSGTGSGGAASAGVAAPSPTRPSFGSGAARPASPAVKPEETKDEDGFQTVGNKWRSKRVAQASGRP